MIELYKQKCLANNDGKAILFGVFRAKYSEG